MKPFVFITDMNLCNLLFTSHVHIYYDSHSAMNSNKSGQPPSPFHNRTSLESSFGVGGVYVVVLFFSYYAFILHDFHRKVLNKAT